MEIERAVDTPRRATGSSTYVPVFTVPRTGSSGFSRNAVTRPDSSTSTSP